MAYQEELCRAIDIASEQAKTAVRRGRLLRRDCKRMALAI
jgi:hypothetical protein